MHLKNWTDVESAIKKLANLEAVVSMREGEATKQIAAIREDLSKKTSSQKEAAAAIRKDIEDFCVQRRDEMEGGRKRLSGAIVGFNKARAKVELPDGVSEAEWIGSVQRLAAVRPFAEQLVNSKLSLNKNALLSMYNNSRTADVEALLARLQERGLVFKQGEEFKIKFNN